MNEPINWSQDLQMQEQLTRRQRALVGELRENLRNEEQTLWRMEGALEVIRRAHSRAASEGSGQTANPAPAPAVTVSESGARVPGGEGGRENPRDVPVSPPTADSLTP